MWRSSTFLSCGIRELEAASSASFELPEVPLTRPKSYSAKEMSEGRRRGMMLGWGGLWNNKATILRVAALACSLQFHRATSSRVFADGPFWGKGQHTFFNPLEQKIQPNAFSSLEPPILDPTLEGSFARHTLHNRLKAVCERLLKEGAFKGECAIRLKLLAAEIPSQLICRPSEISEQGGMCSEEDAALFNAEWKGWTQERAKGDWTVALPLIATEMYLYRRVLDATGYFGQGETRGLDPYQSQKDSALASALASKAFQHAVKMRGSTGEVVDRALLLADLWGNQGDLALAPLDQNNTHAAHKIGNGNGPEKDALLVDESEAALRYLALLGGKARVDFVLDNSGIELLCDFVLADHLLSSGLAEQVVLHGKGEPLFVSDAMPKDVESHVVALEAHSDEGARALGASLRAHAQSGALVVESHMFWTAPRLFWEMPESLAKHLSASSLIIVKGDANYRRLVGDRVWPHTTPLKDVVLPWFPAPLLALRTLKAEIALGLIEGQAEAVGNVYKDWMVTGDFAQVQFVPQPREDGAGERLTESSQ